MRGMANNEFKDATRFFLKLFGYGGGAFAAFIVVGTLLLYLLFNAPLLFLLALVGLGAGLWFWLKK